MKEYFKKNARMAIVQNKMYNNKWLEEPGVHLLKFIKYLDVPSWHLSHIFSWDGPYFVPLDINLYHQHLTKRDI